MGKVIEKVKITNLLDSTRSVEVEAVIDTGATMVVLPQNIVDKPMVRSFSGWPPRVSSQLGINIEMEV